MCTGSTRRKRRPHLNGAGKVKHAILENTGNISINMRVVQPSVTCFAVGCRLLGHGPCWLRDAKHECVQFLQICSCADAESL